MVDFARVTEWISPRFRRPATWVYVTLGVALGGATAHFLQSRISAGFEHAADASTSFAKEMWCQHRNASIKLSDNRFTILVSPLQGDPKGIQTEEMFNALIGQGGVDLVPVCQSLQIDTEGERVTGLRRAIEKGQAILKERHADLILFGKVSAMDGSALVWAINEHGGCANSLEPIKLERGAGPKFESDTKTQLYGAVLKEIASACLHKEDMNWDVFKKQMSKLKYLIFESILKLPEEQQVELLTSYYNGLHLLYQHDGDVEWFNAASAFTDLLLSGEATDLVKLDAWFFGGRALVSKGHKTKDNDALTRSIEVFEHMLPLIPATSPEFRAQVLTTRAEAHSGKGDVELAIQDLDEAIRLQPQDPRVLNSLCYELAIIGRLELALASCNEALNLRPNDLYTLDSRGFTYLKLKQPERAINDYDAVLQQDLKIANSLYGRGLAHLMLGNNDQGNRDIAAAKAIRADIVDEFARYGVK